MLYRRILRPLLFRMPAESAHIFALKALSTTLSSDLLHDLALKRFARSPFGNIKRFGLTFKNPVGLAAGFDKDGVASRSLSALGFGFVEVGTVTFLAQPGNARPRLFRLPMDCALINRLGFNNEGAVAVAKHLGRSRPPCVLGINIGKSRVVPLEEATADYLASLDALHSLADYIAINVSSPNTPDLRKLQQGDALASLLRSVKNRNRELSEKAGRENPVPLLLKISPDLKIRELESIVEAVRSTGLDGIIATNTTISRTNMKSPAAQIKACGEGGLSGAPLRSRSTATVAALYRMVGNAIPIIAVGGIFTATDAWQKICAGASLVQIYTGFIYEGPSVVRLINDGLAKLVGKEGLNSYDEVVGCRANEFARTLPDGYL